MVSHGSTKPTREIEIGHFITPRAWRRYTAHLRGHVGRPSQDAGRERGRAWGMYLY